jgi:hypothetical protein
MSFVHHLVVGCFELHPVVLAPAEREPTALRPLDRPWVERHLAGTDPRLADQFFWTDGGCLRANWYGAGVARSGEVLDLAVEIARHHGDGFMVSHQNNGDVLYPEGIRERQQRFYESGREPTLEAHL